MFANGIGNLPTVIGRPNPRVVMNPDPNNPLIAKPEDPGSSQNFMRLMIEQLRAQDPFSPLSSNEFTSQLAQLNSLEQQVQMNRMLKESIEGERLSNASALIGKYVEGLDAANRFIVGTVEHVEMIDGVATLKVGDSLLLMEQVLMVAPSPTEEEDA